MSGNLPDDCMFPSDLDYHDAMGSDPNDRDEPIGVRCIVCRDVFRAEDAVECWTCSAWLCKAHAQTANGDPFCPEHWPQAVRDYIEALEADTKALVNYRRALVFIAAGLSDPRVLAVCALDGHEIPDPTLADQLTASIAVAREGRAV